MQTQTISVRVVGVTGLGRKASISQEVRQASKAAFAANQNLVSKVQEQILTEGTPETWERTATCTHFRLRKGSVAGQFAEAQVYTHELGIVIRFWVYGPNFETRTRDLLLLNLRGGEKGFDVWLDDGDKVFPHEGGKYAQAGQVILANIRSGQ